LIVGEGPERATLQKKARDLGVDEHILWLGARPQEQVFQLYSIMDLFVMPSLYEGFGLTAVEAMAAGLAVVGTRIEGLSEIIEDGLSGYVVPVADDRELAKAMVSVLSRPDLARSMGQRGRERANALFSMEQFSRAILAAYGQLSKH